MIRQMQGCVIRYGYINRRNEMSLSECELRDNLVTWRYLLEDLPLCPIDRIEGEQNLSSPNMPLCHKEYFELKAIKTQQIQESSLPPP